MMSQERVQRNKAVFFIYSILDENGTILEQSDLPIGYVHGADSGILDKLEQGMEGRVVGDNVSVALTPEEGFGEPDPNLMYTDDINNVPPQFHFVGAEVQMENDQGEVKNFVVSKIEDGKLTVDGNHPLAGKTLKVRITIHEVRDAREGEDKVSGIHAVQMQGPSSIN